MVLGTDSTEPRKAPDQIYEGVRIPVILLCGYGITSVACNLIAKHYRYRYRSVYARIAFAMQAACIPWCRRKEV